MRNPLWFRVGDRVRARTSGFVPVGTHGIVRQILQNVLDMYYVQFDGYEQPHLMHVRDLERVTDEPKARP
jgi:hypothetical protein